MVQRRFRCVESNDVFHTGLSFELFRILGYSIPCDITVKIYLAHDLISSSHVKVEPTENETEDIAASLVKVPCLFFLPIGDMFLFY